MNFLVALLKTSAPRHGDSSRTVLVRRRRQMCVRKRKKARDEGGALYTLAHGRETGWSCASHATLW